MIGALSRRRLLWAGVALGLSSCASAPTLLAPEPRETWPELEPLLGVSANRQGMTIRIASRGCAAKADLVFRVERAKGRALLAFARRRLETCKGPIGEAEFSFTYAELGLERGERFMIANPASSPPR